MKKSDINPMPPNFAKYIDLVADLELEQAFDESSLQLNKLDKDVLNKLGDRRYAPGKWTVKDILQHLADSDRIMSYQALMLARKDESVLQGFDEKLHVEQASAGRRTIDDIIGEIKIARESTIALFDSFDDETFLRRAINWKYEISVLAMGFTIIGHQTHHLSIIKERYLPLLSANS
ncbi:MAG TPA: DinB family protein [Pyrinomonadaceae bacterium]